MKNKYVQIVITIVCIGVIAFSIYLNPDIIRAKTYAELTQDEPPVYSGIITVWQVSSWRVAQSSKTLCLLSVADEFEKKYSFVFVEVENITVEEYEKAIADGRYPDVLSFPAEMHVELSKCNEINEQPHLLPILQQTYYASENKVIPWLYTSSVLVANTKKLTSVKADTSMYQSSEQTVNLINALSSSEASSLGSIYALVPLAASGASIESVPNDISPYSAWCGFVSKESNIIYGSVWQSYSMNRLIDREKGFDCTYVIPSVDMPRFYWTQNLCIFSNDADKNVMINKYIDLLLSDKYQIKLADASASFPASNAKLEYGGIRSDILAGKYSGEMAINPGVGVSYQEIVDALKGDAVAKENLKAKVIIR